MQVHVQEQRLKRSRQAQVIGKIHIIERRAEVIDVVDQRDQQTAAEEKTEESRPVFAPGQEGEGNEAPGGESIQADFLDVVRGRQGALGQLPQLRHRRRFAGIEPLDQPPHHGLRQQIEERRQDLDQIEAAQDFRIETEAGGKAAGLGGVVAIRVVELVPVEAVMHQMAEAQHPEGRPPEDCEHSPGTAVGDRLWPELAMHRLVQGRPIAVGDEGERDQRPDPGGIVPAHQGRDQKIGGKRRGPIGAGEARIQAIIDADGGGRGQGCIHHEAFMAHLGGGGNCLLRIHGVGSLAG